MCTMRILLFAMAGLLALLVRGQSAVLSVGGDALGSGGSVSFSLGQLADDHPAATTGSVQEGVQQPFTDGSTNIAERPVVDMQVYPNITADQVTIVLPKQTDGPWTATVVDAQGRTVLRQVITDARAVLRLSHLASGGYQLLVQDGKHAAHPYTIIKTDRP